MAEGGVGERLERCLMAVSPPEKPESVLEGGGLATAVVVPDSQFTTLVPSYPIHPFSFIAP